MTNVGAESTLLDDVSLHLPAMRLGLVYGRSGAGKSTLLQVCTPQFQLLSRRTADLLITVERNNIIIISHILILYFL